MAASNGGRGSQEAADACSPRRWAIRRRHSVADEGRGGRVVARHIDEQPSQQQSPDDIPKAENITDKLAEIEDMEELDARSINNITGLFAALQMCHENSAKMAGHLVQLGSTLTPKQYTYIMKHSLCPLVQISLPLCLCSPADLKFSKLCLTPQETKEEIGINQCLPRPFHPMLAVLPPKHPTRCLAAIIHTVL